MFLLSVFSIITGEGKEFQSTVSILWEIKSTDGKQKNCSSYGFQPLELQLLYFDFTLALQLGKPEFVYFTFTK
jgi:hypothetical protein